MKPLVLLFFCFVSALADAQAVCPPNLGFENGNFDNWDLNHGLINGDGTINLIQDMGNQRIIKSTDNPELDPYGNFPVTAPNGSGYSIRMGYDFPGRHVDQVVYSLTVPNNIEGFSIIFNYAIVLQNPNHAEYEQPRFRVNVYNETRGAYIQCSSFDFVAGYNQPDFLESPGQPGIFYKPWSSAAINLSSFKGERLRLEFTVNDCSRGGHFGYAYFDVMEKCTNSITGNIICPGSDNVNLQAPAGFADYIWYTGDFGQRLGRGNNFTVNTPTIGERFAVVLEPYAYLGCRDTFYTTITSVSEPLYLEVKDSVNGCSDAGIDLTAADITRGSSSPLQFEYYTDSTASTFVSNPRQITASGNYFIRATNQAGCVQMKPVTVTIFPIPAFSVATPPPISYPAVVNLTTLPDDPVLFYTYYTNSSLTQPVTNPMAVGHSGTFYVKGTNVAGCYSFRPVEVKVSSLLFVPNAFTPNRDGKNDRFIYKALGGLKEISFFKVYNRWGQEVFSTTIPDVGWDGTVKGKPAEPGTYVWILKATDWINRQYNQKGTVTLIR